MSTDKLRSYRAKRDFKKTLVVDGEVVAFDGAVSSFAKLQPRMQLHDPERARKSGITVPLERRSSFDDVRDFARAVAELVAARGPRQFTTEQRKPKRRGRLYLDVMRNAYGQTAVAPYAVRARKGAPVATPITWEELDDRELTPSAFTLKTVPERVQGKADPWRHMARRAAVLGPRASAWRCCNKRDSRAMN